MSFPVVGGGIVAAVAEASGVGHDAGIEAFRHLPGDLVTVVPVMGDELVNQFTCG